MKEMSKQIQTLCVVLLAGIFVVQLLSLIVSASRSNGVAVQPQRTRAMAPGDDTEYGDCWDGTCTPGASGMPGSGGNGGRGSDGSSDVYTNYPEQNDVRILDSFGNCVDC
jgi:hypothetical protein